MSSMGVSQEERMVLMLLYNIVRGPTQTTEPAYGNV
jgi:hypothetical protein